jgi:hypothetical protein
VRFLLLNIIAFGSIGVPEPVWIGGVSLHKNHRYTAI